MVKDQKNRSSSQNRKIFTCSEIESKGAQVSIPSSALPNLKLLDPAIMEFSSKNILARYKIEYLKALKGSRAAQSAPLCLYDPKVIRLNILKSNENHPAHYEQQLRTFTSLLDNLSLTSSNPGWVELLNNFQKSLLGPQNNAGYCYGYDNTQNFNRNVSWSDQKQRLNSQPQADKRTNFFDKSVQHNQLLRSGKGNSCSNERYTNFQRNTSAGSLMNETKSTFNGSMDRSNDDSGKTKESGHSLNGIEPEPEWFSWPASRTDFIDLHGFEDDQIETKAYHKIESSERKQISSNKILFDDFLSYGLRHNGKSASDMPTNQRVNNYRHASSNSQFNLDRHPMSSNSASMNSSDSGHLSGVNIKNCFFEEWKSNDVQNENGMKWIASSNMLTMANIENSIKQSTLPFWNLPSASNHSMGAQLPAAQSVPQIFHKAYSGFQASNNPISGLLMNPFGVNKPTQEQLQQHTSHIMRNALNRKHSQEERKMPK